MLTRPTDQQTATKKRGKEERENINNHSSTSAALGAQATFFPSLCVTRFERKFAYNLTTLGGTAKASTRVVILSCSFLVATKPQELAWKDHTTPGVIGQQPGTRRRLLRNALCVWGLQNKALLLKHLQHKLWLRLMHTSALRTSSRSHKASFRC